MVDDETRGLIEKALDAVLEQDIVNVIEWVRSEAPLKSPLDFALGYVLGSSMRFAYSVALFEKKNKKIDREWEKKFGHKPPWKSMETRPARFDLTKRSTNKSRTC